MPSHTFDEDEVADLARLLGKPAAARSLADCRASGARVAALRPNGRLTRAGDWSRIYLTGQDRDWSGRLARRLRGKPHEVRVDASALLRFENFHRLCEDDSDFRAACLRGGGLTWELVTRLLPVPDPALRLKLARKCVAEGLTTRAVRDRVFEAAGYPPPRGVPGAKAGKGRRSGSAVANRRMARLRDLLAAALGQWLAKGGALAHLRRDRPAGVDRADVTALGAALEELSKSADRLTARLGKVNAAFARAAADRRAEWSGTAAG